MALVRLSYGSEPVSVTYDKHGVPTDRDGYVYGTECPLPHGGNHRYSRMGPGRAQMYECTGCQTIVTAQMLHVRIPRHVKRAHIEAWGMLPDRSPYAPEETAAQEPRA